MRIQSFVSSLAGSLAIAALVAACSGPTDATSSSKFVVKGNSTGSEVDGQVLLAADSLAWLSGGPTTPVAGATVAYARRRIVIVQPDTAGGGYQTYVYDSLGFETAGADGHFMINGLAPDWYQLRVVPATGQAIAAGGVLELYLDGGTGSSGVTVRLVVFKQ